MNKISYFIGLALMALLFNSCTNEQLLQNESVVANTPQYWVDEGILNFSSGEAYQKLNDRLSGMNMEEIKAWEDSLGFTSFRTEYYAVLDELENIETKEAYYKLIDSNSDIVYVDDYIIAPTIKQSSYQRTCNREGLFIINGIVQKATATELLIFDDICYNSAHELENLTKENNTWTRKSTFKSSTILKSVNTTYCGDTENETSDITDDNKWCKAAFIVEPNHYAASGTDINYCYEVTCKSYSYRKRFGITGLYNSLHACYDLECVVEAPYSYYNCDCECTVETTKDYTITYSSTEPTVTPSTTKIKTWLDGKKVGGYSLNTPLPDPVFKRVKGIFWTSGTEYQNTAEINCGYGY